MIDAATFDAARAALLREHARDPRPAPEGDGATASEAYHRAVVAWLDRLVPEASPELRLAAWAQHLARYEVPRGDHPPGRRGYLAWRRAAAEHQARTARRVLEGAGVPAESAGRVADLVRKKGLGRDPEAQALEDAACLAFLEREALGFASSRDPEDVLRILSKTLRKMSEPARRLAVSHASILEAVRALVETAGARGTVRSGP